MGHQLGQVGSFEGVASGQYHHRSRSTIGSQIIKKGFAFRGRQLLGVTPGYGVGATVKTGELTSPGDLPDDNEGT